MLGFGIKIQVKEVKDTLSKKDPPISNVSWNKLVPHTVSLIEWRLYND